MRRTDGRLLLAAALSVLTAACGVTLEQEDFLYPAPGTDPLPDEDVSRENVVLETEDGTELRGWMLRAPESRGVLVFFYGNAQSVAGIAYELFLLADRLRLDVLAIDYRGYGFSGGAPTFARLRRDGLRVVDYAKERAGGRPVNLLGYSLGTGVAVHAAAHRDVGRVVLIAPLASPKAMVEAIESRLPWYARLFFDLEMGPGFARVEPPPDREIRQVTEPLLVVHGTADRVIPIGQGRRMYELAASEPKRFCPVPDAGHALSFARTAIYRRCLTSFLDDQSD